MLTLMVSGSGLMDLPLSSPIGLKASLVVVLRKTAWRWTAPLWDKAAGMTFHAAAKAQFPMPMSAPMMPVSAANSAKIRFLKWNAFDAATQKDTKRLDSFSSN